LNSNKDVKKDGKDMSMLKDFNKDGKDIKRDSRELMETKDLKELSQLVHLQLTTI